MNIRKVTELTGMTADTIRYYEKIGMIPPIKRVSGISGIRQFDEDDVKWIDFVKHMREAGLSVDALVAYVHLFQEGQGMAAERKEILKGQATILKDKMAKMSQTLEMLEYKIDNYESLVFPAEDALESFDRNKK